ncbi:hypothetical protein DFH08DRAFT_317868 [Mycena albidolilacea]|uniref:F-box domain-containing protein n=1 Tax=Mycena albidolilacea TaxID=1033008 RepID=A0AAD7EIW2_9AGAR|nr:hypothetical protein DFH08DRAFT_317868 [Mycena albidolilacea]
MSAQELRARIDELSIEIDLQKEILKKLERDRSLARRQLNAVVDPVARLPLEISSKIFLKSLNQSVVPQPAELVLLLNICNSWTNIALSTPDLWTSFRIDFPCPKGVVHALPFWFGRASNCPVSLFLTGNLTAFKFDAGVSAIIWEHGGQLKCLNIYDKQPPYEDPDLNIIDLFDDETTPRPLPLLERLKVGTLHEGRVFSAPQIFRLLSLAPKIDTCIFDKIVRWDNLDFAPDKLVVPTLGQLVFGDLGGYPDGDADVLDHLSLPALEALSVSIATKRDELRLSSFLRRSSPPLQVLALGLPYNLPDPIQPHISLHLIPSLVRLKLHAPMQSVADFFAALAEAPSLLPNLHTLTIDSMALDSPSISASSWRTLLRVLSARRIQIRITSVTEPPVDVLAALRELAVDGPQIYVGNTERNFVDSLSGEVVFLA